MVEARFRRGHPDASDEEVGEHVRSWWIDRLGAPDGDAVGIAGGARLDLFRRDDAKSVGT